MNCVTQKGVKRRLKADATAVKLRRGMGRANAECRGGRGCRSTKYGLRSSGGKTRRVRLLPHIRFALQRLTVLDSRRNTFDDSC
uniref:50S ribosomal protein L18 n=1 Tax=Ascaris lumbricoides TaxID=6252 RepID=A0A0M3HYW5_ASCLU